MLPTATQGRKNESHSWVGGLPGVEPVAGHTGIRRIRGTATRAAGGAVAHRHSSTVIGAENHRRKDDRFGKAVRQEGRLSQVLGNLVRPLPATDASFRKYLRARRTGSRSNRNQCGIQ